MKTVLKATVKPALTALTALLLGLQAASAWAQANCNTAIPLTRPDSRYEAVAGATPAGSEVLDKVTGLIWQRCLLGMAWNGSTCTGTASTHTWQQALDAARNAPASVAASGAAAAWRLPNQAELFSLTERACYNPAINVTWFPATPAAWVWASSPVAYNSDLAWSVFFSSGHGGWGYKGDADRVRLVRSGQ